MLRSVDPINIRDLFLMEEKLLGLLFPLVRESNETEKFVQLALPPHLEVASFGRPGWTKNRVVVERLVGNQDYVFGLVDRLQNILPAMLEQIQEVNSEAARNIELLFSKHEIPVDEEFTKYSSTESDKLFSKHCLDDEQSDSKTAVSAQICRNIPHSIMLAPLKVEIISQSPALFLLHDILTEGQRESLLTSLENSDKGETNFFDPKEKLIMKQLSQKLAFVEAFKETAEIKPDLFEFEGIVPGTHVTPAHLDTVLVFLTDVSGGEVVLPDHNIKLEPVAGSAVISPLITGLRYGHCHVTNGVMWVGKHH